MKYKFVKSYESLKEELVFLKADCEQLLETNKEDEINVFYNSLDKWRTKVKVCLKKGIRPYPEFLLDILSYSSVDRYDLSVHWRYIRNLGEDERVRAIEAAVRSRVKGLDLVKSHLLIMNDLKMSEQAEVNTIQDKFDFIMEKLNLVFGDNYYSIQALLDMSSIQYRSNEPTEIGKNLTKKGYVKPESIQNYDFVKLTVKGALYVERKIKSENKKSAKKWEVEVNRKVDIVLEKLQSLEYGQEIIFDEIEELKSLSGKLKRKTWVQLLKGKVFDLAFDEVISRETASYILETLSTEASKLLKD